MQPGARLDDFLALVIGAEYSSRIMKRIIPLATVLLVPLAASLHAADVPSAPKLGGAPVNIGSKTQLFVDQLLVRSSDGISYQVHAGNKHPANPLLKADQPWEGWRLGFYGNVLYDDALKKFRMW